MCRNSLHRHGVFCIVPPHMLREIALNGSPQQRAAALRTLGVDQTLRAGRAELRLAGPARARPQLTLAGEGAKIRTIYDAQHQQNLPGTLVRAEGAPPTNDPAADEA